MQSKNKVIIFSISIFETPEQTVESNFSADRVRKKRPPSYFAIATWTSLLLQSSRHVQSKNRVDLVEVSIFYKSEKMSSQTVRPKKINHSAYVPYHGCLVF